MNYFKYKTYTRSQINLINAYSSNMIAYLRRRHPDTSIEEIKAFIKKTIEERFISRQMKIVSYPSYGNAKLETVDLLSYLDVIQNNIITPAGVLYVKPSKKESFLKKKIKKNLKRRKAQKKTMLEAAAIGDLVSEQVAHYLQASTKIETNSIPGAFGSPFNCLFDIPGYNAITATSRHSIMCGYSHVEKLIAGNFYFPTINHLINYCIQLCRVCPKNIMDVVNRYGIYIPTTQDLSDHFSTSIRHYIHINDEVKTKIYSALDSFTIHEKTFIYYGYCLKTLFGKNEVFFKSYLKEFFKKDVESLQKEPSSIYSFNPDLMAIVTSLNSKLIHNQPVSDALKDCPEGVQKLIDIASHMELKLKDLSDIWEIFLKIDVDVADAMSHPNMIRKAVIISDTDSVLFSTQDWINWYVGKISFEQAAYEMNAFVVFLVVMTLEQVFARLSTNFGCEGEDIYKISMKNEFMYPLMLRTPLPKQYAGLVHIQEGFVLPKPKDDIKGLSFRSSTMCKETILAGDAFRKWIFDEVYQNGTIKASDCIQKALAHEKRIIESLELGDKTFLTTKPIRQKTEYKDLSASVYYYWELWDHVFKPKFGEFIIPAKAFTLPLLNDGKILKDQSYLDRVATFDKKMHDRLLDFMEKNKRPITSIYIPMTLKKIPIILRPIIDVRQIVFSNSTPFIVTLRSLGLGYTDSKYQTLLSDIYQ